MNTKVESAAATQSADLETEVLENLSIDDIIGQAYDEAAEAEFEEVDDPKKIDTPKTDAPKTDAPAADEAAADPAAATTETQQPDAIEPPNHWSAEDKAAFGEVPRKTQEWMLKRDKEMSRGINEKFEQVADIKRRGQQIDEILSPLRQHYSAQGLDDAGAVRQLAAWYQGLQVNPVQTLRQLATFFKTDISKLQQQEDEYVDPMIANLQAELGGTKQTLEQLQQQAQQDRQTTIVRQIQEFAEAKDAQGNLQRPHFAAVSEDITRLLQNGFATSLDDAYAKAVAWRPELTAAPAPAPAPAAAPAPAPAPNAERARKAKLAASGIRSSTAQPKGQEYDSWEDAVSAAVGD
jgi:hypothetical protein